MSVLLRSEFPHAPGYRDYPIKEAMAKADEIIAQGGQIFQKFSCGNCGARLGMETPNVFYAAGTCDSCGATTQIERCNFMAAFGIPPRQDR